MKWTDKSNTKDILFKDLEIGDGFEDSSSLYIKISDDRAFDIINDEITSFDSSSIVIPRDCEIIFH